MQFFLNVAHKKQKIDIQINQICKNTILSTLCLWFFKIVSTQFNKTSWQRAVNSRVKNFGILFLFYSMNQFSPLYSFRFNEHLRISNVRTKWAKAKIGCALIAPNALLTKWRRNFKIHQATWAEVSGKV